MCNITYKPADAVVDLDVMRTAFEANPDGWGIMARTDKGLAIVKMANPRSDRDKEAFDKFVAAYEPFKNCEVGIHFRARTHGGIDLDNTHPYAVLSRAEGDPVDMFLMHNGVLRNFGTYAQNGRSDTGDFIDRRLCPMIRKFGTALLDDHSFQDMLESYVGSNKLLIMGEGLKPIFINKTLGTVHKDLWYSNSAYAPRTATTIHHYMGRRHQWHGPWDEGSTVSPPTDGRGSIGGTAGSTVVTSSTSANAGGGAQRVIPFSQSSKSSGQSDNSRKPNGKSSGEANGPSPNASIVAESIRGVSQVLNDGDFRRIYLDGNDDPRVSGTLIPFEALRYLTEDDLESCILNNPDGILELLMDLKQSFNFNSKDDESFRCEVLTNA